MRLLVDACVSLLVVQALRAQGHDVAHVAEWDKDPGDNEILSQALAEEQVVITRDKDFGTLAVWRGAIHAGIVQLRKLPLRDQASACQAALRSHQDELRHGAVVTVQPGRIRVRLPRRA